MAKETNPPKDYIPFKELILCSNKFIDGLIPISVDGNIPLLIGKGDLPLIWLATQVKVGLKWKYIVVENVSLSRHIEIIISKQNRTVFIDFKKDNERRIRILNVTQESDDKAVVNELDLRPIGLNIHGNDKEMLIGTNTLSKNTFQNVRTMIAIGGK